MRLLVLLALLLSPGVALAQSAGYPLVFRVQPQLAPDTDSSTAVATQNYVNLAFVPVAVAAGGTSCSLSPTVLTALHNVITSGTVGQYVTVPSVAFGVEVQLTNDLPVSINVCPANTGITFNPGTSGLSAGSPVSIPTGGFLRVFCLTTTACYAK